MDVEVRKWGNSLGVVIPKKEAERLDIKPGEQVSLRIEKKNALNELFGALKFDESTTDLLKESREGESKWL